MARVIDYWRGLVADIREAESSSPADLRAIGDLWYPVLQMRVLASVHDGAERRLGPVDLPAAQAEQVARRVWEELLAALHKRAVPEAWPDYASVITLLKPWLCRQLHADEAGLPDALAAMSGPRLEAISDDAFHALNPGRLSSRGEQTFRGAITAYLFQARQWPDLGTWVPFTLYSLTARYFEQGSFLGQKRCASETEILDLVELAPFGREWALHVVEQRAQARTVESYKQVLNAVLDGAELPGGGTTIARRLTLVEWLSDPEARLARLAEVQGSEVSEAVISRAFRAEDRAVLLSVLRGALGTAPYPEGIGPDARKAALQRLLEAMEGCAVRTELLVHTGAGRGKRGAEWARAVVNARAPKSDRRCQVGLLDAIVARRDHRTVAPAQQRNRSLRSLHRLLRTASRPDAGISWEVADVAARAR